MALVPGVDPREMRCKEPGPQCPAHTHALEMDGLAAPRRRDLGWLQDNADITVLLRPPK